MLQEGFAEILFIVFTRFFGQTGVQHDLKTLPKHYPKKVRHKNSQSPLAICRNRQVQSRMSVAELKTLVKRPDVVEVWVLDSEMG